MCKVIYYDPKYELLIFRIHETIKLMHHNTILLEINNDLEEIDILKKLYNAVVNNHHELKIYYKGKYLVKKHLKKYPKINFEQMGKVVKEFEFLENLRLDIKID